MTQPAKKTGTTAKKRRVRGSISIDEIINGAFTLASEVTLENLSMPMLAKKLDLGVTSIYWHFRSKDALIAAMTDRALQEFNAAMPTIVDEKWYSGLRTYAYAMRDIFRANPVMCDLLIMRPSANGIDNDRVTCERLESALSVLVGAGFTADDALDTYYSIVVFARALAMTERTRHLTEATVDHSAITDPGTMPILSGLINDGYPIDTTADRSFDIGVEALIDRAKRVLRATKGTRRSADGSAAARSAR
ncbi:TetR family transcriptional regulator [Gordonia rhizosphera]|uniref:Putative TetR family transcriptional regulator n=1 Tax=Gordonia rhizosphera NBRC 16068 TaxID=1108045 RepID=K6WBH1_9ACTN|nr:TetR family transcriptional regulator [Gordonia rhizosphera]GAB89547.1 putative TetR family transcriptional regulator [Gordonia rhizosphera NBRC 16068]